MAVTPAPDDSVTVTGLLVNSGPAGEMTTFGARWRFCERTGGRLFVRAVGSPK